MYPFDYVRPATLAEAAALAAGNPDAKFLSGGHTLLPAMKLRLASPTALIDLSGVAALRGIERTGDSLRVGALSTHREVAESPVVRDAIPTLAALAGSIGDPAVRGRGTVGGSLANNDPSADYAAALLALAGTVVTDRRRIPADDYFQGLFATALDEAEIVTAVEWPIPRRMGYEKIRNPASRYALCGVCVVESASGAVRVTVTGAGADGVFRVPAMEDALARAFAPESLAGLTGDPAAMASDIHADPEYRAHLVGVVARRAVAGAR